MKNELVLVAKLGRTHGLMGYIKLHNKSDFINQFKKDRVFYNKNQEKFIIKHFDKQNMLVQFCGYESLDSVARLVNMELYSTIEETRKNIKLQKNEYFYFDIIGLDVIENDENLGKVEDILEQGSGYLLLIQTNENLINLGLSKNFYIPYHDNFIIKVEQGIINVKNSKSILENS